LTSVQDEKKRKTGHGGWISQGPGPKCVGANGLAARTTESTQGPMSIRAYEAFKGRESGHRRRRTKP